MGVCMNEKGDANPTQTLAVLTLATVAAVSLLLALARKVAELVAFVALLLVAATRSLVSAEGRGSTGPAVPSDMSGTFAFVAGWSGNHISMRFYIGRGERE